MTGIESLETGLGESGTTAGDAIEVLKNRGLGPVALFGEGAFIPNPGEMGSPYLGRYTLDTLLSADMYRTNFPWTAVTTVPVAEDIGSRSFRSEHLSINSAISAYPNILEDLTNRYKTSTLVDAQAEEYINKKYELFEQLLHATIEVPKEFRVRSQASPTFDMSKLSSMPMPTGTDTTTATATLGTAGGSSY